MVDENGLSIERKWMIRCGLALDVDGEWRTEQLSEELQKIVGAYPDEFNGAIPQYPEQVQ